MLARLLLIVALLTAVILTSGCTTIESGTGVTRIVQAGVADTLTTGIILARGGHELNPAGFAGATVGKLFYLYKREDLTPEDRNRYDRFATAIWSGAAGSNALQLLVPGSGLLLGLGVGLYIGLTVWEGW